MVVRREGGGKQGSWKNHNAGHLSSDALIGQPGGEVMISLLLMFPSPATRPPPVHSHRNLLHKPSSLFFLPPPT